MGKAPFLMPKDNYPSNPIGRPRSSGWDWKVKSCSTPEPRSISQSNDTSIARGTQASPYLTKKDITSILLEARKVESLAYTRPPYPEEMAKKPYPANYTPPIFPKYAWLGMLESLPGDIWMPWRLTLMTMSWGSGSSLSPWRVEPSLSTPTFCQGSVLCWNNMAT